VTRGRLRILLGAAPGVGKTYTMLEEGRRLAAEGRDVVVALVETHGRAATAAQVEGLETLPRRRSEHRGVELDELDVDAVIARAPDIALVDELAHTNAPGSATEKRWQDVETILAAGISVISTVNVQHIESLGDVVAEITGVRQRETVPDRVVRSADQIEVVDLAPQALRDRLAGGHVYPAPRIDAALSNYFRLGNLTALRELALLWLADEVDSALQRYRAEQGIDSTWQARERVVVALTGGPEGDTLLRRGARIAARSSGGELLAVHVTSHDGLRGEHPGALEEQRSLTERLGGTFHQLVGDDVPTTLVSFARSVNATQLVIGVSRRGRLAALVTGPGIGATVVAKSGDIDVHMVTHAQAGGRVALPRPGRGLTARRRIAGLAVALVGGPLLTWLLTTFRSDDSITSDVLAYQLLVLVVALLGGLWPALFAAVLSGLTLDFFFIDPLYTVTVADPLHLLALLLYVVNAVLVSAVVDQAASRTRLARRAEAESQLLVTVAGSVLRGTDVVQALVDRVREAFAFTSVEVEGRGVVLAASRAPAGPDEPVLVLPLADGALSLAGREPTPAERRLLDVVRAQLDIALENRDLALTATAARGLEEVDRVRSALLAAVGHDVRRPLAAASAALGTLRSPGLPLTDDDRSELLETADDAVRRLAALLADLLDLSRLEAGALAVAVQPVGIEDCLAPALEELGLGPDDIDLDIDPALPTVLADPVLLRRVIVNLLANAERFSPTGERVRVSASAFSGAVELRIADRGPGIAPDRRADVFTPFQRLGDTDNDTGLGLGLALSRGFVEGMHGELELDDTPGGGLTMVVRLPEEDGARRAGERRDGAVTVAETPGEPVERAEEPA